MTRIFLNVNKDGCLFKITKYQYNNLRQTLDLMVCHTRVTFPRRSKTSRTLTCAQWKRSGVASERGVVA